MADLTQHPLVGLGVTLAMVGWQVEAVTAGTVTLVHLQHAIWPDRYPLVSVTVPLADFELFAGRKSVADAERSVCPRCGHRFFWHDVEKCGGCGHDPAAERLWATAEISGPVDQVVGPYWMRLNGGAG